MFRKINVSTYASLGKLLGQRCLEAGVSTIRYRQDDKSERLSAFINTLKESGVELEEPPEYIHAYGNSWIVHGPLKPWTVEV